MTDARYRANPVSRQDIRNYSKALRCNLHLEDTEYIDIIRLMEYVFPEAFKKYNFSFDILSKEELGKNHGLTNPKSGKIFIREDIYKGACHGVGRDRLTVAHELGHFLFHDGITLGLARARSDEHIPAYCDPEWQATAFAGEFLMDHDVIKNMTPEEVMRRCGVSYQAAIIQKGK